MAILTITLNPALDLSTDTERVKSGGKLRCGPARYDPGGGGVNVSRAIAKLGGESLAFIAIAGATGQMLKSLLESEGVEASWFKVDGLTRESVVVNERSSGKQFRFVMPGPVWNDDKVEALRAIFKKTFAKANRIIDYAVVSGSLPPGIPDDFYHKIAELAENAGISLVLDTSGRALKAAALGKSHLPYIWIMDQGEAESVADKPIADIDALALFAEELKSRELAEIIVLTFGQGGAVVVSGTEKLRILPPKVDVVSKVGAGDSFAAGFVMKLAQGESLYESCAYAVAAAASAVTTPATQLCDKAQTERYFAMIMNE